MMTAIFVLMGLIGGLLLGSEYELRRVTRYLDAHAHESGHALAAGVHAERHRDGAPALEPGVDPDDVVGVCAGCKRALVPSTRLGGGPWEDDLGNAGCGGWTAEPHIRVP